MPGVLIGSGRAADVYDAGPGRVLRRYREDFSAEPEGEIMEFVRRAGYPVPRVFEAQGRDLVMERVQGPTMLVDLARRPWMLRSHAATLAELHSRLQAIKAPPDLTTLAEAPGETVFHGDLHIDNVILTAAGPVVIDWSNTRRADAFADVVMTWVVLAAAQAPGSAWMRAVASMGRNLFIGRFLRGFDPDATRRLLSPIGRLKLQDSHMSAGELLAITRLIAGEAGP